MTETPRTDEIAQTLTFNYVPADFARQLERELAEARKVREREMDMLGNTPDVLVSRELLAGWQRAANRSPGDVEIRLNPDGTLDEVCAPGVHLEQMAGNSWFLSVGEVNLWLNAKGKITVTYEDNRKQ